MLKTKAKRWKEERLSEKKEEKILRGKKIRWWLTGKEKGLKGDKFFQFIFGGE